MHNINYLNIIKSDSQIKPHPTNEIQKTIQPQRINEISARTIVPPAPQYHTTTYLPQSPSSSVNKLDQIKVKPPQHTTTYLPQSPSSSVNKIDTTLVKTAPLKYTNSLNEKSIKETHYDKTGAKPELVEYNKMLGFFEYLHDTKNALRIFDEMKKNGVKPSVENYNSMIHLYAHNQDENSLKGSLRDMEENGVNPNAWTYHYVLKFYTLKGDADSAIRTICEAKIDSLSLEENGQLIKLMFQKLYPQKRDWPKKISYLYLLSFYIRNKDIEMVNKLLPALKKFNISLDSNMYCSLIAFYAKHDPNSAYRLFNEMQTAGLKLNKDIYYGIIKICLNQGNLQGALSHIKEMHKHQIKPDATIYHGLIILYLKRGDIEQAKLVIQTMKENHIKTNCNTYRILLSYCTENKHLEFLDWIMQQMQAEKFNPTSLILRDMISLYTAMEKDPVKELAQCIKKYKFENKETISKLQSIINGYIRRQELTLAEALSKQFGLEFNPNIVESLPLENDNPLALTAALEIEAIKNTMDPNFIVKSTSIKSDHEEEHKTPEPLDLQALIQIFVKRKEFESIDKVIEELKKNRISLGISDWLLLTRFYVDNKQGNYLENLITEMKKGNILRDIAIFNGILQFYVIQNFQAKILKILDDLRECQLKPDLNTYNILLQLYAQNINLNEINNILKEMDVNDLKPDSYTYKTLLFMHIRRKDWININKILTAMRETVFKPFNITSTAFDVHSKGCEESKKIIREINSMGFAFDAVAYTSILHLFASLGNIHGAYDIFTEMKKKYIPPNILTYNNLLKYYIDKKDAEGAYQLLNEMQGSGVQADKVTMNLMIDLHVFRQEMDKARELTKKYGFKPTINSDGQLNLNDLSHGTAYMMVRKWLKKSKNKHEILISDLRQSRPYNEMLSLKNFIMKQVELHHPEYCFGKTENFGQIILINQEQLNEYNNMLDFFVLAYDAKNALRILEEMKKNEVNPSVATYNILFRHYAHNNDIERVNKLLNDIEKQNISLDSEMYSSLILFYAHKDPKSAYRLFHEMQTAGFKPQRAIFEAMIKICVNQDNLEGVLGHIQEMQNHQLKPNVSTYNSLIMLYVKRADIDSPKKIVQTMIDNHIKPVRYTYVWLLLYCKEKNNLEIAEWALQQMKAYKINPNALAFSCLISIYKAQKKDPVIELAFCLKKFEFEGKDTTRALKSLIHGYITRQELPMAEALSKQFGLEYNPNAAESLSLEKENPITLHEIEENESTQETKDPLAQTLRVTDPDSAKEWITIDQLQTLLPLFVRRKDREGIDKVIEVMKKQSLQHNIYTYNSLLKYYVDNLDVNEAYQLFNQMQLDKLEVDDVTIGILIDLHVFRQEFTRAEELVVEYNIKPKITAKKLDLHNLTHGTAYMMVRNWLSICKYQHIRIITGQGLHGRNKKMFGMKNFITEQIKLYHPAYSFVKSENPGEIILINNFLNNDRYEENIFAYNLMLFFFASLNDTNNTLRIFNKMKKEGVQPNKAITCSLQCLINGYISSQELTLAEALSKQFGLEYNPKAFVPLPSENDHTLSLNQIVEKKTIEPSQTHHEIKEGGEPFKADQLYNLFNIFMKRKDLKGIGKVLEIMNTQNIAISRNAYDQLILLYLSMDDLKGVYDIKRQMKQHNIQPNVVFYNSLLKCHVDNKDVKEAYHLLKEMHEEKIIADAVTKQLMIDLHVFRNEFSKAEELRREYGYALEPNIKGNSLYLHNLSYGTAYIMARKCLYTKDMKTLKIIISLGDKTFAQKKFLIKQIQLYHPDYSVRESPNQEFIILNKQTFDYQPSKPSFVPSYDTYISLIDSYIKSEQSNHAFCTLTEMRENHFILPKKTALNLLKLFADKKLALYLHKENLDKVFTILTQMKEEKLTFNSKWYRWLIKKYLFINERKKVSAILKLL